MRGRWILSWRIEAAGTSLRFVIDSIWPHHVGYRLYSLEAAQARLSCIHPPSKAVGYMASASTSPVEAFSLFPIWWTNGRTRCRQGVSRTWGWGRLCKRWPTGQKRSPQPLRADAPGSGISPHRLQPPEQCAGRVQTLFLIKKSYALIFWKYDIYLHVEIGADVRVSKPHTTLNRVFSYYTRVLYFFANVVTAANVALCPTTLLSKTINCKTQRWWNEFDSRNKIILKINSQHLGIFMKVLLSLHDNIILCWQKS